MKRRIDYKKSVLKDLKGIDRSRRIKLLDQIENNLAVNIFTGKQLHGNYKGLFSYRCGDYRVIYTVTQESVLILRISHRKDVYNY